jgi:hypothetical protein
MYVIRLELRFGNISCYYLSRRLTGLFHGGAELL